MQERHKNRRMYYDELANTSKKYFIDYVESSLYLSPETNVLEIGCGEGGNLVPFAEHGCHVTGIDIDGVKIENARSFFLEDDLVGYFIHSDFLKIPVPRKDEDKFDLILIHDVIEHIEKPYKHDFIEHLKLFMKPTTIVFFRFPAWQMPFGGHQQICKGKISKIPFIHLLPEKIYHRILVKANEPSSTIEELHSIRRSKMPIEGFEKIICQAGMKVAKKTFWVINPHYEQKFKLKPLKEFWPFSAIPYFRNFYTTSAWYLVKQ